MNQPQSVASVFSRAWELLTRNWIIIVPGIVVGAVVGIISGFLGFLGPPGSHWSVEYDVNPALAMTWVGGAFVRGIVLAGIAVLAAGAGGGAGTEELFVRGIILAGVGILAYIATTAYTVSMAGAAWARGTTTLADGSAAFKEEGGNVAMTALGLIGLGIVAATLLLLPWTWSGVNPVLIVSSQMISLLAFWIFTLYAMPAAIIGKRPGFSSIAESFRIATQRFVPTLIIGILIAVISFCAGLLTLPLYLIPFLGPIVSSVITQIVIPFAMLVIVGEYLNLRAAAAIAPPVSTRSL